MGFSIFGIMVDFWDFLFFEMMVSHGIFYFWNNG